MVSLGATQCLRKRLRPATLLSAIDECLSETGQHRNMPQRSRPSTARRRTLRERGALELGAARCLRKPFTPGTPLAVINEYLAEARSRFTGIVQSG
ncbi:hypothetical protein [Bradyrhizobium australiense]|uniref:Uncharacterized protein n=1 Tax=Bradyrhizobium australiense TaxID=2721161 RepID=A0A7Y4GYN6_9BRAD|nr:hypothetical protein [Bradyrhizobium australiense]NOJ44074.1 hypothetical protein [Bradyrhizobium australiense]